MGRHPRDPWEPWNRDVYRFNEQLDAKVLKPVQSGIVRTYAAGVAIGTVALAVFVIMRMGF